MLCISLLIYLCDRLFPFVEMEASNTFFPSTSHCLRFNEVHMKILNCALRNNNYIIFLLFNSVRFTSKQPFYIRMLVYLIKV